MIPSGTKPMSWIALGSLALTLFHGTSAEECPSTVTLTKTETITVWADGSWPTSTVTQIVHPDNCPLEPRYPCYVVSTTTVSTSLSKATIHMVFPHEQLGQNKQENEDGDSRTKDDEGYYDEGPQNDTYRAQAPTITVPDNPVPTATGPACVHYVTTIGFAPCPTFTPLPLNSDGCAIITSTSVALTAATAVPERPIRKNGIDVDVDVTYTCSIGAETQHHKHKQRKHLMPIITPVPERVLASVAPLHVPQLNGPTEIGTSHSSDFSTLYSYTLSFDFNYGSETSAPSRITGYPELPGPTTPPSTPSAKRHPGSLLAPSADPAPEPIADAKTAAPPALPVPGPAPPVPTSDATTPAVVPPPGPIPAEDPRTGTGVEVVDPPINVNTPTTMSPMANPPTAVDQKSITSPLAHPSRTVDPPTPGPTPVTPAHKACDACASPCAVEMDVVANAEVPLLVRLFQDKIRSALASLRISLENETGAAATSADDATGVFGKLSADENAKMAGVFRKACEAKIKEIEDRRFAGLKAKMEQVVGSTCETGECLQAEVDKAVRLLDVMISTELARDVSQLRVELVSEFKARYVEEDKKRAALAVSVDVDAPLEKRSGLLGSLIGPVVRGTMDKVVHKVGDVVADAVKEVSPPLGDLVKSLINVLTGKVKSVVDSFVGNCNRKGLLDFDTEQGVGSLAAIADVSLDLFRLVCVKAAVDTSVDVASK